MKQKTKKRSPPLLLPRNRAVWPNATIVVILRPHQTLSPRQRMRKLSRKREGRVEADLLREAGLVVLHLQGLEGNGHLALKGMSSVGCMLGMCLSMSANEIPEGLGRGRGWEGLATIVNH